MPQELPQLPAGQPNFENLRLANSAYVDKTMYFPMLKKISDYIFCARPRRFGKSLTITALDAYFSGRTELFQGLAVERDMNSSEFVTSPVIRLDMGRPAGSDSKTILQTNILDPLRDNAKRHGVTLRGADSARTFFSLISDVHEESGKKVVVLIDEYDAPVIRIVQMERSLSQKRLLNDTREIIRDFYSQLKFAAEHIEFVFITGVTKFSRMGVFSLLNNLFDISLRPEFGEFMGYTQKELENYFAPYIKKTAEELNIGEEKLLKEISRHYDGFSFDGITSLYNPFSVLAFFSERRFDNFWMESGANAIVRKFLKDNALLAEQFEGMVVNRTFVREPGEIDATPPAGFLYQAGYLTLRVRGENSYSLCYPNSEVREAISTLFLENLALETSWTGIGVAGEELKRCLEDADVPGMVDVFIRLFADICYADHSKADLDPADGILTNIFRKVGLFLSIFKQRKLNESLAEFFRRKLGEGFYRSILHSSLCMAGATVTPERPVGLGRIDLLAVCGAITYVIELKMAEDAQRRTNGALAGMSQINEKGYGRAFKNPILVSLAIGRKERNIVACRFKINGQEKVVDIKELEKSSSYQVEVL
ncbi:MAG: ATP-binding protein [Deltaproteobacteria bacterium]|jgi:hypothetical protein|nr:ATP-binding protein [Deltaproteobacteria bacterium]